MGLRRKDAAGSLTKLINYCKVLRVNLTAEM